MSVDLSQFLPSFLEESYEGLEIMENGLLNLESGDYESINAIFRAAHSIKGGAGTFGFDDVTDFTHLAETLLDEMRDGRRDISAADIEILLQSVDCIKLLIDAAKEGETCDDEKIVEVSQKLSETLAIIQSPDVDTDSSQEINETSDAGVWRIIFEPEHHLAQTGNDPLFLFSALADFGSLSIRCICDDIPPFEELDPQEIFLKWQIDLTSNVSEEDVREIFEWVEDECKLEISRLAPDDDVTVETTDSNELAVESESSESNTAANSELSNENINEPTFSENSAIEEQSTQEKITEKIEKQTKAKQEVSSIRVSVDKVDSLINLVGELVITQSMLSELGNDFDLSKVERLTSGLEQLLQNTKELQESVMRIRMLPISFAFNRFPRLIHDLSNKTGKDIELIIKGEQTELDKTVMEQIGDPLVHLVRNAVDHGIETSDIRIKHGKPAKGTISLDAYHQGGNIVIEISDDGGGINKQVVLTKAKEKGLIEEGSNLTDSQIYDLIFEPGFSTAKELSDISGRGVGMDVVKRNIQSLGGRIQIESKQGEGSKFRVILPLTLAILDGQLVKVGTEVFVIPLISIVESLQIKQDLINHASGDMVLYRLREDNVPILPIYKLFGLEAEHKNLDNSLLVVVESDGQKIGLMVDDLLAQQQVVIKSLVDNYQQVSGISGATILGDGSVAMIIDIPGIINMALEQAQYSHSQSVSYNVDEEVL